MTRDHAHEFGSWLCRVDAYVGDTASSQSLITGQIAMYLQISQLSLVWAIQYTSYAPQIIDRPMASVPRSC